MPKEPTNKSSEITQDTKIIAALSYIWVLCLLPLLLKRGNAFCQFHARQGLLLFIFSFVVALLLVIPILGPLLLILWLIISVIGLVSALQGKEWEIPYLSSYAKKLKV